MVRPNISYFVEPILFTDKQKKRLQIFSDDPGFIKAVEAVAASQMALLKHTPLIHPKELGKRLAAIQIKAKELDELIFDYNIFSILGGSESIAKQAYLERLHRDLIKLVNATTDSLSMRDWKGNTKLDSLRLDMVGQVYRVLLAYGIKPTVYDNGPWAVAVSIILDLCDDKKADVRNQLRAYSKKYLSITKS